MNGTRRQGSTLYSKKWNCSFRGTRSRRSVVQRAAAFQRTWSRPIGNPACQRAVVRHAARRYPPPGVAACWPAPAAGSLRSRDRGGAAYEDADLKRGEDLLESWGLINACFRGSPVLRFTAHGVRVQPGRRLSELSAAPYRAPVWREESAVEALLGLVLKARSRCVRVWAIQMLEREHAARLSRLAPERLVALLDPRRGSATFAARRLVAGAAPADRPWLH
jgi:hypothetical protein